MLASRWLAALAVAACVGIALGVVLGLTRPRSASTTQDAKALALHGQVRWAPGAKRAPGFVLRGSVGSLVSLRSERRRIVLLTFLDSRCKRACPLEGRLLGQVQRDLRGTNVPVSLLVVTADPWGDTRKSIRTFMREVRWTLPWHWLGGSPSELRPVWRAYGVAVKRVPGDIVHSVVLYVIDSRGYQRTAYLFPFSPRDVAQDIRRVAAAA
jgi:cytochrome oxidase Cu insertion factor (SCO1/SenC/PrrC family)